MIILVVYDNKSMISKQDNIKINDNSDQHAAAMAILLYVLCMCPGDYRVSIPARYTITNKYQTNRYTYTSKCINYSNQ